LDANTVQVIVDLNGGAPRTVSFKVNSNDFNEVVSFTQETGHTDYLTPSVSSLSVTGNTQYQNVFVSSCSPWDVESSPSWAVARATSGVNLEIQFLKNQSGVSRSGFVEILNMDGINAFIQEHKIRYKLKGDK
jgi:hypothetical protein